MFDRMKEEEGIGLAAIQIGKPIRMFVIDIKKKESDKDGSDMESDGEFVDYGRFCMVNPEIIWKSEEQSSYDEGCLSCPGVRAEIFRPSRVKAKYFDENGNEKTVAASGLLATCIQHEYDHLDGVLFIDYLSRIKQNMLFKKIAKKLEHNEKV